MLATVILFLIELSGNLGVANFLLQFIELSVHRRIRFRLAGFVDEEWGIFTLMSMR
jgi:hypothetical protein